MATTEWCSCSSEQPWTHLFEADKIGSPEFPIYVHALCLRPSYEAWLFHLKYCLECGRQFSSPWESACESCFVHFNSDQGDLYLSWGRAKHLQESWQIRYFGKLFH